MGARMIVLIVVSALIGSALLLFVRPVVWPAFLLMAVLVPVSLIVPRFAPRGKRILVTLLLGIASLLLPLAAVPLAIAMGSVSMLPAFIDEFEVVNRSGETIFITPIGACGDEGFRGRLPLYRSRFPALPLWRDGDFRLTDGESIRILYDMDDINFSEIVVRNEAGLYRQLVTDPTPTENRYHGPLKKSYTIESFHGLQEVPENVLRAVKGRSTALFFCRAFIAGLVVLVVFVFGIVRYRRLKRTETA